MLNKISESKSESGMEIEIDARKWGGAQTTHG